MKCSETAPVTVALAVSRLSGTLWIAMYLEIPAEFHEANAAWPGGSGQSPGAMPLIEMSDCPKAHPDAPLVMR